MMPLDQCDMHFRREATPGPPWKWGGGSVASAGPTPWYYFNEPLLSSLSSLVSLSPLLLAVLPSSLSSLHSSRCLFSVGLGGSSPLESHP